MALHTIRDNRIVELSEEEELAATATKPGALAKHLANRYGLARRFAPVGAWFINADKPERVDIVEVRGAGAEWSPPVEYALTADGRLLPVLYLFPVARHCKPRLATLRDDYGTCQQWVAPLKARCKGPWS